MQSTANLNPTSLKISLYVSQVSAINETRKRASLSHFGVCSDASIRAVWTLCKTSMQTLVANTGLRHLQKLRPDAINHSVQSESVLPRHRRRKRSSRYARPKSAVQSKGPRLHLKWGAADFSQQTAGRNLPIFSFKPTPTLVTCKFQ